MSTISTFLVNDTNESTYYIHDKNRRYTNNTIEMDHIIALAESSAFWAIRGKTIEKYAQLERSLCSLFRQSADLSKLSASTVFFKIASASSRNNIVDKLVRQKHGNTYNLFWNSYFQQMRAIDNKRNELVHWTTAAFARLSDGYLSIGLHLIPPHSIDQEGAVETKFSPDEMIDFATKCDIYARLCNIFIGMHLPTTVRDDAWQNVFQSPLAYPLPSNHPLHVSPAVP